MGRRGERAAFQRVFAFPNGPLLIERAGKSYVTAAPEATAGVDLGADLAQQGAGGARVFETVGVEGRMGGGRERKRRKRLGWGGVGGRWLHADSQACRVCVPALKCHLEGRADGREAGGAGAAERSGTLGIGRHGALILHGLPSISVHTQDIPSA